MYVYRIHVIADAQMLQNQSRYGLAWISVEQTLIGKKLRVLAKDLGCSQNEAIGILINLWLWGMDNKGKAL